MTFAFIFESVGSGEWLVLLAVVLVVVGPKNLPAAARKLGSVLSQLRRAADEFKRQLMTMDQEVRSTVDEIKKDYVDVPDAQPLPEGEPGAPVDGGAQDANGGAGENAADGDDRAASDYGDSGYDYDRAYGREYGYDDAAPGMESAAAENVAAPSADVAPPPAGEEPPPSQPQPSSDETASVAC